jgi:hypothetical protein
MIPYLIELTDHNLRIRSPEELLVQSPGYANIVGASPVFGELAKSQARQHPRHSFNAFWSQLSLDPLTIKSKHFRHNADLAYSHLLSLTQGLNMPEGAVLAVPGSFARAQLAVLLGVVKQCAFNTVGLVDLALLQAADTVPDNNADSIIIDLQLHQAVLTSFRHIGGFVVRERVVQIPSAGLLALQDAWLNMITDEFIRQCRFDPQRDAESEQYIVNQLGALLAQTHHNHEQILEINLKGVVQQAHLTFDLFEQKALPVFARIQKKLEELRGPSTSLHVTTAHVNLPGLTRSIPGLTALDDDVVMHNFVRNVAHIRQNADSLQLVTRLPLEATTARTLQPAPTRVPTHLLLQHKATALPMGRLILGAAVAGVESSRILPLTSEGFSGAIALLRSTRGVQLELHTASPVLHNGKSAQNGQLLAMGDTLQLGTKGVELQLIVVEQAT